MRVRNYGGFPGGRGPGHGAPKPEGGDPLKRELEKELLLLSIKEELIKAGLIKKADRDENEI